jgi:hypothetical protein
MRTKALDRSRHSGRPHLEVEIKILTFVVVLALPTLGVYQAYHERS